jgi:hypothetical protein
MVASARLTVAVGQHPDHRSVASEVLHRLYLVTILSVHDHSQLAMH